MENAKFSAYTEDSWIIFTKNNIDKNKHTYQDEGDVDEIPFSCSTNNTKVARTGHIIMTQLDGSTAKPITITIVQQPTKKQMRTILTRDKGDLVTFSHDGVIEESGFRVKPYPYLDGYYYATLETPVSTTGTGNVSAIVSNRGSGMANVSIRRTFAADTVEKAVDAAMTKFSADDFRIIKERPEEATINP
jgi:hypothetical protein